MENKFDYFIPDDFVDKEILRNKLEEVYDNITMNSNYSDIYQKYDFETLALVIVVKLAKINFYDYTAFQLFNEYKKFMDVNIHKYDDLSLYKIGVDVILIDAFCKQFE